MNSSSLSNIVKTIITVKYNTINWVDKEIIIHILLILETLEQIGVIQGHYMCVNIKGNTIDFVSLPVELMKELIFASLLPSKQNA